MTRPGVRHMTAILGQVRFRRRLGDGHRGTSPMSRLGATRPHHMADPGRAADAPRIGDDRASHRLPPAHRWKLVAYEPHPVNVDDHTSSMHDEQVEELQTAPRHSEVRPLPPPGHAWKHCTDRGRRSGRRSRSPSRRILGTWTYG
jgi:hypothetical protein